MKRNHRSLGTLGTALWAVMAIILVVAPAAWAQSKYKTLYRFTGGLTDLHL
jgi:hypothetical protein